MCVSLASCIHESKRESNEHLWSFEPDTLYLTLFSLWFYSWTCNSCSTSNLFLAEFITLVRVVAVTYRFSPSNTIHRDFQSDPSQISLDNV